MELNAEQSDQKPQADRITVAT